VCKVTGFLHTLQTWFITCSARESMWIDVDRWPNKKPQHPKALRLFVRGRA
jgi:hypothetical protein